MKSLLIILLLISSCGQANEVKSTRRCFMVESMSMGRLYCSDMAQSGSILYDCVSEEGIHVKKVIGAVNIYIGVCEGK